MTKKQREALTALRDVMREYDIEIRHSVQHHGYLVRYIIGGEWAASDEWGKVGEQRLTKILEQETE